ncbi:MAG: PhoH family protein [Deltaproteobacteria bacterium]|nr:PhoH family protein [Deltaproteobacteria bacterium]
MAKSAAQNKKIFVLDTNVILHDSDSLRHFADNDIIIPITVLEELDNFKRGNEIINYHARQFVRTLDELCRDAIFNNGVEIGPGLGKISIRLDEEMAPEIKKSFNPLKKDHHILNLAYIITHQNKKQKVILVTKDVNLRMKAKAVGLLAEDYTSDHIKDVKTLYTGTRIIEEVADELIDQLYSDEENPALSELSLSEPLKPNEYMVLRSAHKSALATCDNQQKLITRVEKRAVSGIIPRNAEQIFALNALLNPNISLVTISGKAGTGKTLLALAAGLEQRNLYRQIYLARPIVPLSNKDIGYLPGDISDKISPYTQPLFDNLGVIQAHSREGKNTPHYRKMLEDKKLVISALSYIRGRSLVKIFFIVDEAQNLTPHEVKTIVTRAGENTKIVFTGDIFQIDHPYLDSHSNGLSHIIAKMQGEKLYAHINLEKGERSELADLASNLL